MTRRFPALPGRRSVRFPGEAVLMVCNPAGNYGLAEAEEILLAVQQVPTGPVHGSDSLTRRPPCWGGALHLYFNLHFLPHGRGLRPIFERLQPLQRGHWPSKLERQKWVDSCSPCQHLRSLVANVRCAADCGHRQSERRMTASADQATDGTCRQRPLSSLQPSLDCSRRFWAELAPR
jgi:hypothetical protein